ncbi:Oidioi.mRNA.OKI2018_I69.chr1.g1235.t1.cds [Oikopleura dioica]|uniref:Oidioi.mRNA.OKI2018_I69.chr1.g1235.t1.cds n=1 Tax=Oikopleura dioica TaxID=34765 RepID=A0ABN7SMU3_OIKDI|nr:Oidioi.mRNA.OKI2018_I69.chr1.g1235.t1.cds [Oikopleura dioica]
MVATSKIYNLRLYEIALEYAEEADHVPVEYADDFNKLTRELADNLDFDNDGVQLIENMILADNDDESVSLHSSDSDMTADPEWAPLPGQIVADSAEQYSSDDSSSAMSEDDCQCEQCNDDNEDEPIMRDASTQTEVEMVVPRFERLHATSNSSIAINIPSDDDLEVFFEGSTEPSNSDYVVLEQMVETAHTMHPIESARKIKRKNPVPRRMKPRRLFPKKAYDKNKTGKYQFTLEAFWSPKTCYYEIVSNGKVLFHPIPYFMLVKSLQMMEKRFERIADFAIEMPDLKFFNYHGPFSPDNYFTIAKEIRREIILYTNSNQFQLKKRVAFQRIGRFRVKNPKVEEPLYLFVKKDEPSRIFVVYNTNAFKSNIYRCSNTNCNMTFVKADTRDAHEAICRKRANREIEPTLKAYGKNINPISELVKLGLLEEKYKSFRKTKFVTFDIETYESPLGDKRQETEIHSSLKLLSIGIGSNFGFDKFIMRKGDSSIHAENMVEEFVLTIEGLTMSPEMSLPPAFSVALEKLYGLTNSEENLKEKMKLQSLLNELKRYCSMDIYGFNSAKFDCNVLAPYLIPLLQKRYSKSFNVIKKGSSFFSISTDKFAFKDAMLFGSPIGLAKYLEQAGIGETKSIWPYELFHSISEIETCHEFPDYDCFFSHLKNVNIDHDLYLEEKGKFEEMKRNNPQTSMVDWLQNYNMLDVNPFARAIESQFKVFFKAFKVDPSLCFSLPKYAMICLFNYYSKTAPFSYSFGITSTEEHELFRSNIIGGLVNVFSRYTELRDDVPAPKNAKYAPNGDRFTKITFLDFNALYLYAQNQEMPTTPGIRWIREGDSFRKQIMAKGNSLVALEWLTYIDEYSDLLVSKNGERVPLQHQYYRGEFQVFDWTIDGYACVDEKKYFFEFLGCFFHSCCPYCKPGEADENWERKKNVLMERGTLVFIHECVWKRKKQQNIRMRSRHWGKMYQQHTEGDLLDEIKNDQVFGFIVADVNTPEDIASEIKHMNFPPVIQRMKITEDLVSPYMKERAKMADRKIEQETVVQTFNGKQLLILTKLAKFYMSLGLKISNVSRFVQYRSDKCLGEFCESITEGRIQSILKKKAALANAFKTVGNCGYGKMGEIVDRPRVNFCNEDQVARAAQKPHYKFSEPLTREDGDYELSQVTMEKAKILDDKPVVLAVAILQQSKLLFLRFVYDFLHKYLEKGSFKLNYCDTDSLAISTTKTAPSGETRKSKTASTFLPIVKPHLRKAFLREWQDWFVIEDTTRNDKTPGLMKTEWSTESGALIALGNKLYLGIDPEKDVNKRSSKGIPHNVEIEFEAMLNCLKGVNLEENKFQLTALRRQPSNGLVCRTSTSKRLLSDVFFKLYVNNDKITCTPLSKDGKLL